MQNELIRRIVTALTAGFAAFFLMTIQSVVCGATEKRPSAHENHGAAVSPANQEPEKPPAVEIPDDKRRLIGVKTVSVAVRPFVKTVRTAGIVEIDERKMTTISVKFEGWVEKLHADYTGKHVRKGDPLFDLYSPELLATQREFLLALKWRVRPEGAGEPSGIGAMLARDAEALIGASRERLRLWDISDAQVKEVEETGKPMRTFTVYSPANGYVVRKNVLQGTKVGPGERLLELADLSTVWIIADIYEYELPFVSAGQKAVLTLSSVPGREFRSTVDFLYPSVAGETRTVKVRFTVDNPDGRLKPQMFTNVEVKIDLGKRLSVPRDAIIDTGARQVVYVDRGEGMFEPREIGTGATFGDITEIRDGLKAGEKVAASATFLIDSEAKLKGVTPLPRRR